MSTVKLIECPRDAWQGLKGMIPADLKADYLKALISAGFKNIDAVSFVSPNAVPQMADSEEVLKELDPPDDVEIIGIVVNEKGAQRAIDDSGGFHSGISLFDFGNVSAQEPKSIPRRRARRAGRIQKKADEAGLNVVVYISMAFGNPYGDPWSVGEVMDAIELLEAENLHMISLADTVGMATPQQVGELVGSVMRKYDYLEIGVHLHSRPEQAAERILAAYDAGCRRFDSALGGLGGCPFAQDALVGNIPTETVINTLRQRGAELPMLKPLDTLLKATGGIAAKYSESHAAD